MNKQAKFGAIVHNQNDPSSVLGMSLCMWEVLLGKRRGFSTLQWLSPLIRRITLQTRIGERTLLCLGDIRMLLCEITEHKLKVKCRSHFYVRKGVGVIAKCALSDYLYIAKWMVFLWFCSCMEMKIFIVQHLMVELLSVPTVSSWRYLISHSSVLYFTFGHQQVLFHLGVINDIS